MQPELSIEYYKTNIGNFFRLTGSYHYRDLSIYSIISINGVSVNDIPFENGWYRLEGELKDFVYQPKESTKIVGYKIIDARLVSDVLPQYIPIEDIETEYDDIEERTVWVGSYSDFERYYVPEYRKEVPEPIVIQPNLKLIRELRIDNYEAPQKMEVTYKEVGLWKATEKVVDLAKIATVSELEALLTPEFLIHTRRHTLSSKVMYSIVRDHVTKNINPRQAKITSNYDFCFAVSKIVHTKPYSVSKEVLTKAARSYKPPRFKTEATTEKLVPIFEMTWAGYRSATTGYDGYTCIEPLRGDTLKELYDNLMRYLDDLMYAINHDMRECEHCNGIGYLKGK